VTDTEVAEAAGRIAGRYILGESLGRGGMAEVVRAYDERTGRDVAVKLFRADVAEARDLRRIRSEIRMLAGLNHPSLVHLYDASTGDERSPAYLVLELVDGPTLADLIGGGIAARDLAQLLAQASDALAYIHARGIVHRDVKPENILVGRDAHGRPLAKLADLGIARIVDETRLTVVGGVLGTAAYLSPEQVTGDPVGTATDIYALGLVLLEGLTGRRAFAGTAAESAVGRTVRAPRLPVGLAPADADLLRRMTALDAGSRIDAASAGERLMGWSSPGPFWADQSSTALTRPVTGVTEQIIPPVSPAPQDYAATRVLSAAPTAAFDSRPGAPLVSPQSTATDVFAPLGPSGWTPAYRPVPYSPAPYAPASGEPRETPQRRPRRLARRMTVGVIALLVLGGATAAIWPTAVSILTPAPIPAPPAYPSAEGQLGADLVALQTSLEGGGLALEALTILRADALAVSTAAAAPDLTAASSALYTMADHLDAATIDDQVTSARYRAALEALGVVSTDLDAAIAAEEAAAEAAEAAAEQAAAEQAAAEEAARQAEQESGSTGSGSDPSDVFGDIQDWWDEQTRQLEEQFTG